MHTAKATPVANTLTSSTLPDAHANIVATDALLAEYAQELPLPGESSRVARLSCVFQNIGALRAHLHTVLAIQSEQQRRLEFRATMLTARELQTPLIEDVFRSYSGSIQPLVRTALRMSSVTVRQTDTFCKPLTL